MNKRPIDFEDISRYPQRLMSGFTFSSKGFNVVLMVLAASGWGWAISQRMDSGRPSGTLTDGRPTAKGSQRHDRAGHDPLASVMSNPRSADLLAHFEEILSAAQSGVPNEKLIRACEGALTDGDFECRVRDIALLLEVMRPEDAPALHDLFLRLHREKGLGFPMEYAAFARAWGNVDPSGALEHLAAEKPFRMPAADVANIIGGWAERDPGAALKWIEDHPELEAGNGAYAHLLGGWMVYDRDAATKFLTEREMRPDQLFQSVFHCTNGILYGGGGADESVAWLAALPEEGLFPAAASRAWDITSGNYGELPYDHAAQVWGTIADRSWLSFGQFQRFSQSVANGRANEQGLAGFIDALAESWPTKQASGKFAAWYQKDPQAVSRWLDQAPESDWVAAIRASLPDPVDAGGIAPGSGDVPSR